MNKIKKTEVEYMSNGKKIIDRIQKEGERIQNIALIVGGSVKRIQACK